jgi:nicotinate-nucleotide adenylyltransferase
MRIALFGGTFDPVHQGHLTIARAAVKKFDLDLVYFVPADLPPHKVKRHLTAFQHRYAMLALATEGESKFVPSLLEVRSGEPNYSIHTVRKAKAALKKSDKLFFLIGMDAFKDIATWRQPVELLTECDFIVVSRPGYSLREIFQALPEKLRPADAMSSRANNGAISLGKTQVYLLDGLRAGASSTLIRAAARRRGKLFSRYVPKAVAEYIQKERLYR